MQQFGWHYNVFQRVYLLAVAVVVDIQGTELAVKYLPYFGAPYTRGPPPHPPTPRPRDTSLPSSASINWALFYPRHHLSLSHALSSISFFQISLALTFRLVLHLSLSLSLTRTYCSASPSSLRHNPQHPQHLKFWNPPSLKVRTLLLSSNLTLILASYVLENERMQNRD